MAEFPLDAERCAAFVAAALAEDIGAGDITSLATISASITADYTINAREALVLCGVPLAVEAFRQQGIVPTVLAHDGQLLPAGAAIMHVSGNVQAILRAERVALNFLQLLSGMATLTRHYVEKIKHTKALLRDTRKTMPQYRLLSKYAVACGGGTNHRLRLDDAFLIKDNHLAAAGGITAAIQAARAYKNLPIQLECDTLLQVQEALKAGADSILLDNMTIPKLREAVTLAAGRVPLEASGGITLETIGDVAQTGVDYISTSRITFAAAAVDIGLDEATP
jgi:nicotinate-nucleotide pyrophosphorylase (carboxylating)